MILWFWLLKYKKYKKKKKIKKIKNQEICYIHRRTFVKKYI